MKYLFPFLLLAFVVFSCDVKKNNDFVSEDFTKIYDDQDFDSKYEGLDVKRSADGGYIVLSVYNDSRIKVMKINAEGELEWEHLVADTYVNLVQELVNDNNDFYFMCSRNVSYESCVMHVELDSQRVEEVKSFGDELYPLAFKKVADGFLYMNYNRDNQATVVHKLNANFDEEWKSKYAVQQSVEDTVLLHVSRFIDTQPVFLEEGKSSFIFNGFYNYNLVNVYMNKTSGKELGAIYGDRFRAGVSALHFSNNKNTASMSVFSSSGEASLLPKVDLNESGISSISQYSDLKFPEIAYKSKVKINDLTLNGKAYIIYAVNSKDGQIILYFFDGASGALVSSKFIGHNHQYSIANFETHDDGGITLLATTVLASRFERLAVFHWSPLTIESWL